MENSSSWFFFFFSLISKGGVFFDFFKISLLLQGLAEDFLTEMESWGVHGAVVFIWNQNELAAGKSQDSSSVYQGK